MDLFPRPAGCVHVLKPDPSVDGGIIHSLPHPGRDGTPRGALRSITEVQFWQDGVCLLRSLSPNSGGGTLERPRFLRKGGSLRTRRPRRSSRRQRHRSLG
jgi:hypothetical protein